MNPIFIKATSLSDAWFQSLYALVQHGRTFTIDRGSYEGQIRLELDYFTAQITHPSTVPLLPKVPSHYGFPDPVEDDYIDGYLPYLMTDELKPGESYTYGQRICGVKVDLINSGPHERFLDDIMTGPTLLRKAFKEVGKDTLMSQLEYMIWTYKTKGHRNNQMILQVGQPSDMGLIDPPCLRHIDTRIQNGKLHFFPYFRSWDLYGGFPANLAAIELMKQYCASEIGVENGQIIASSKGLHIYDYVFEIAEALRGLQPGEITKRNQQEA